jgi:hypothetical protein
VKISLKDIFSKNESKTKWVGTGIPLNLEFKKECKKSFSNKKFL